MKISKERYGSGAYFAATRHFYEEVFEDDSLSARGGAESASFMKRLGTFLARKDSSLGFCSKSGIAKPNPTWSCCTKLEFTCSNRRFLRKGSCSERKGTWVQFKGGHRHFFENPARQNERLIETIFCFLGEAYGRVPYFSFVVFGKNAKSGTSGWNAGSIRW